MTEVAEDAFARNRRTREAEMAGYPLWLHARAHLILMTLGCGALALATSVLVGWRTIAWAGEILAVLACTAVLWYGASVARYKIGRKRTAERPVAGA